LHKKKLTLSIDNPSPRVGEEIMLYINSDFFTDYLKKQVDSTDSMFVSGGLSNGFNRFITFKKAKRHTLGPFNFEFNGVKYTTTSVKVDVLPELKMEAGIWIRIKKHEGITYLILEQLIKDESDKNGNSYTVGGKRPAGTEFADLKSKPTTGIRIIGYNSSRGKIGVNIENFSSPGFSYSSIKYKVQFDEDFKGSYLITEKDFENLPKDFPIDYIELKK
jgi:hypothetical protein